MKKILLPVTFAGVLMASGCATILNDDTQSLNVRTSNNSKITASVDGKQVETPGSVLVKRQQDDLLVSTAAENCAKETRVESHVDDVFWFNVLNPGVGFTTDFSSSTNMWEYDTDIVVNCNN